MNISRKKIFTLWFISISIIFLLSACTPKQEITSKKDFFIQMQEAGSFSNNIQLEKPWKIAWSKEILVSAQVIGRINKIYVEEWSQIKWGSKVINLSDDIANYKLQLQQTKNNLDSAILNHAQVKNNLNQWLENTNLALIQAEYNFEMTQKSTEQSLKQAQQNLDNTSLEGWSISQLNIENVVSQIQNEIEWLQNNFSVQKTQSINALNDVLHQCDNILWATNDYKSINDSFERYLWVKNTQQLRETKALLLALYTTKDKIIDLPNNPSNQEILLAIPSIKKGYDDSLILLEEMIQMLKNSSTAGSFTLTDVNSKLSVIDWLQSSIQWANLGFTTYQIQAESLLSDIDSFLSTEEQFNGLAQQQILLAIKNAEISQKNAQIVYDSTTIQVENTLFNAETALKNAKLAYESNKDNKNIQLDILKNTISQSRLAYEDAQTRYNKLSVRSPIAGTIWSILSDEWQEVNMGSPLFTIISHKEQIIEIYVTSEEYKLLKENQKVWIISNDEFVDGKIISINPIAWQNTLYKINIELNKNLELMGNIADVYIPVELENKVLPINIINIQKDWKWYVYIFKNEEAIKYEISLWKIRGDKIEITSTLPPKLQIITTDIGNYDSEKHLLKKINKEE